MDSQLIVMLITPLSTLAIVMVGFLYNSSRMSDLRSGLKSVIKLHGDRFDAKLETIRIEVTKNHSEMLHRFAMLDDRITRLEAKLGVK